MTEHVALESDKDGTVTSINTAKENVTFDTFDDALNFLHRERMATQAQFNKYRQNVKEMTGFYPDDKIGPMEVVAIIKRVMGGNGGEHIPT